MCLLDLGEQLVGCDKPSRELWLSCKQNIREVSEEKAEHEIISTFNISLTVVTLLQ